MFALFIFYCIAGFAITRNKSSLRERLTYLWIITAGSWVLITQYGFLLWAPHSFWNFARIWPIKLLLAGEPLYSGANAGIVNGNLYGPYAHYFYLPALLANDIDVQVMLGSALSTLILLIPSMLIIGEFITEPKNKRITLAAGTIFFLLIVQSSEPLRQVFRNIHADAPAIGISALALYFINRHLRNNDNVSLYAACALAATAVWTKQIAVPVVVLIPIIMWRLKSLQSGRKTLNHMISIGLAVSVVTLLICRQFSEVYLNIWKIPGSHPWFTTLFENNFPKIVSSPGKLGMKLQVLVEACAEITIHSIVIFAILFIFGLVVKKLKAVNFSEFTGKNLLSVIWLGLLFLPMGLLGRVKVGGDLNPFGFPLYFFALVCSILFVITLQKIGEISIFPNLTKSIKHLTFLALIILTGLTATWISAKRLNQAVKWKTIPKWSEDEAVAYLKSHDKCYFPWNPVAHLEAKKQAVHFQYAIYDRDLAGLPITQEHYALGLPPSTAYVVIPNHPMRIYPTMVTLTNRFQIIAPPDKDSFEGWLIYQVRVLDSKEVDYNLLIKNTP